RSALRAALAPQCVSGLVANSDDLAGCASEPRPSDMLLGIPAAATQRRSVIEGRKFKGIALRASRAGLARPRHRWRAQLALQWRRGCAVPFNPLERSPQR
ncbi:MAG: hypothetical protein RR758_11110, partial [Burkholderiaceae bacterium]